ncbi:2-hydroxyisoflavanone dehydratase-like [Syzygium oleosum]|uniref:2-hydroxyisoflavanone dehydratase-like n=1 Tax=Syzygium oleosum TaxID=219896 RepID=UPI0011D1C172|nr:2-hydroxyisoflavanone dehydratase-like [Syzygium oleosum]
MGSICTSKEVERELPTLLRVYKDGTVERLSGTPYVPPCLEDPKTGVASKDITIREDPLIRARLHLPKLEPVDEQPQKLPVLVYYHGGGFCFESAFSLVEHQYLTTLVAEAKILAVSIEYRLAPECPIPSIYDDCWEALQWVASHSVEGGAAVKEPWLADHGDFRRVFIAGDSAGANIAHNVLMRAGRDTIVGGIKISGAYLTHPYFWGSEPIGSEPKTDHDKDLPHLVWTFLYPTVKDGIDSPMINPLATGAPSLAGLGCGRLLVSVAEKDLLRDRGLKYCEAVKESGFKGELEVVEVEGEDHAFHIVTYEKESALVLIKRLAAFLNKSC